MNQGQQPRWRPTRRQVLWTVGIVATAVVLAYIGYFIPRTGFGQTDVKEGVQPAKTLWDWMDLLIIPIVLAIGGFLFTRSENRATQAAAERRAQDEALQAYLGQMSAMLLPRNDQPSLYDEPPPESMRTLARARTLTVLPRLDGDRKARVVQFLYEARLLEADLPPSWDEPMLRGEPIVSLKFADLRGAILVRAGLRNINLGYADLREANLSHAYLLESDLRGADLRGAELREANLVGADLYEANLWYATGLSDARLMNARLKSAKMPNGQRYEDELNSKSRGEAKENSSP